ncbi:hypothetical protein [Butyrivibrio sp. LC3010]|uniref:hypothetical protein n=1 Tax=Butyrivibrio sp. LC3010 TaxID=1280680 RepID=UPI0004179803|nr:hypothetical protein [Butyrivibrio sp. LC3010]
MSSEKERWEILDKLDMGYSLDEDNSGQVIEDIIVDDKTFLEASNGLYSRSEYMQAKTDVELSYALMQDPPEGLVEKLLKAKRNVEDYINSKRIFIQAK